MNAATTKKTAPAQRQSATSHTSESPRQAGEPTKPYDGNRVDPRSQMRAAMWTAGIHAEDAGITITYEVEPLLALCEFVAHAHEALSDFDLSASGDEVLSERLAAINPGWRTAVVGDGNLMSHIAHCMSLARKLCRKAVGETDAAQAATHEALDRAADDAQRQGGGDHG